MMVSISKVYNNDHVENTEQTLSYQTCAGDCPGCHAPGGRNQILPALQRLAVEEKWARLGAMGSGGAYLYEVRPVMQYSIQKFAVFLFIR